MVESREFGLLEEEVRTEEEEKGEWSVMVCFHQGEIVMVCVLQDHSFLRSRILGRHVTILWDPMRSRHHCMIITPIDAMNPMMRMGEMMLVPVRCGRS